MIPEAQIRLLYDLTGFDVGRVLGADIIVDGETAAVVSRDTLSKVCREMDDTNPESCHTPPRAG